MSKVFFFKKKKITLKKLFPSKNINRDFVINDVKTLHSAKKNDLSFFDKISYSSTALKTNAGACITTENLKKHLNKKTNIIVVKNVLYELAIILNKIYSFADIDYPDLSLKNPQLSNTGLLNLVIMF